MQVNREHLESLLHRFTDERASPALCRVPFAKVSSYADDIIVFVSHQMDILAVKKVVKKYEEVVSAKINSD